MSDIKNDSLGDCPANHYSRSSDLKMDADCIKSTKNILQCSAKTHTGALTEDEAPSVFGPNNKCMFPFALDINSQCGDPSTSTYCNHTKYTNCGGRQCTQINCDSNGNFEAWDCMGVPITNSSPPPRCPADIVPG